ncbi:hypothetical protein LINGRAHAP2_LOCUS11063, partial [Linum grandiflorum]
FESSGTGSKGQWTKLSITQPLGLRLAHRQRLRIRDSKGNLLASSELHRS